MPRARNAPNDWPAVPLERHVDRVFLQPAMVVALGDFTGQHRARRTVDVLDVDLEGNRRL